MRVFGFRFLVFGRNQPPKTVQKNDNRNQKSKTKTKNRNPKAVFPLQFFTIKAKKTLDQNDFICVLECEKAKAKFQKLKRGKKMSLKNKFFSALTMAFAVFAFSTFVSAQETTKTDSDNTQKQEKREWRKGKRDGMGKGFRRGGGGRGGFMLGFRDLNLTDAQKGQIKTIMESNRPDQATTEEMKTLFEAKRNGTLTADQQERMKTLKQQSREKGQAVHQQILAILTPEQLQQLEAKKAEMKQRREERKQRRLQNNEVPQTEKKDN